MSIQCRLVTLIVCAALSSLNVAAPVLADECESSMLATVAARIADGPAAIPSYSANLQIHAKMHGFPFLGITMTGASTYQRPGNYTLLLNSAPRAVDGVGELVHDLSEDIMSSDHWSTYDESASCAAAGKLSVHLVPKTTGDTKTIDLIVDAPAARVVKATFVRNDGTITVEQQFDTIRGRDVVVHQQLILALSRVKADVTVDYRDINLTEVVAGP